jgi:cell division protein FtsN
MTTPAAMTVHPVAATWPTPVAQWLPPVNHPSSTTHHTPVAPVVPGATQGHVIQLGAFTSAQSAERAKSILAERNPQLRGHSFMITQATVNGHAYWRVVTSGFDRPTAQQTCANLKRHGGACFAYAADHAPQGETLALANTRGEGFGGVRRHR